MWYNKLHRVNLFFLFILFGVVKTSWSQNYNEGKHEYHPIVTDEKDSARHSILRKGLMEGHVRTYQMSTWNKESNPDYHALAFGIGIGYISPTIKGFQFAISGFTIHRLYSNELYKEGVHRSRYELPLFDVENPDNKHDMDRMEHFYLKYGFRKSHLKAGKMMLVTPFVNPQDSRMRPNLQEGIWLEMNEIKNLRLSGGIIYKNSPRGTINWYNMGESIGLYPHGYNYFGNHNYHGIIKSDFLAIGQVLYILKQSSFELWNYHADRLFNLSFFKTLIKFPTAHDNYNYVVGLQGLYQQALDYKPNQGVYLYANEKSIISSGRIGVESKSYDFYLNGTYAWDEGRFIFPREWGREPFFTFIPRDRMEGNGSVKATSINYHRRHQGKLKGLRTNIASGIFFYPDIDNQLLNKYKTPSYSQTNLSINYKFENKLDGLEINVLYAYKHSLNTMPLESYHNRMNLHHLNLILDYYF
jgi:hypothetical protein